MNLTLLTRPVLEPVTLEEVREYLKLPPASEDILIPSLISAARSYVEGATGRSLLKQKWGLEITPPYPRTSPLVRWAEEGIEIRLPCPPILEIEAVIGNGKPLPFEVEAAKIVLSPRHYNKRLTIEYWAGYGEDPSHIPEALKFATLMAVRSFYENEKPDNTLLYPFKTRHCI